MKILFNYVAIFYQRRNAQRTFGDLFEIDDANVVFWRVGDLLIGHILNKPFGTYCNCRTAVLQKQAMVALIPGFRELFIG